MKPSPRKQRIEVREQEKASIVNCKAITKSSSGFKDLSLCDKATFDECQDAKLPTVSATLPQADADKPPNIRHRMSARNYEAKIQAAVCAGMPPLPALPQVKPFIRRLSDEGQSTVGSLGSGNSYKEIKGYDAAASLVKNPPKVMRPPSSRGGRSSSLSLYRPASYTDLIGRDTANAKNQTDLLHTRQTLEAYSKHAAALERLCREAGLLVPEMTLPLPLPPPPPRGTIPHIMPRGHTQSLARCSSGGSSLGGISSSGGSSLISPPGGDSCKLGELNTGGGLKSSQAKSSQVKSRSLDLT